jgi:hypothetical protein
MPDAEDPKPHAPRIPVILSGTTGLSIENMGIIDSGSTEVYVNREIADILGLESGEEIKVETAGGLTIGHESSISIEIPLKHNPIKLSNIPCCILNDLNETILGRTGFFQAFEITFCEAERWVSLKDIRSKRSVRMIRQK